jgi:hypothetical protein
MARAISEVFISISASKIAHVIIDDAFDISLQIPVPVSIHCLPTIREKGWPGLWLTTANSFEDDEHLEHSNLAKHFALLLLDEEDKILAEIQDESRNLSTALSQYIKASKPTLS